ncbi:MAG TPA: isocitrate lyase/phosphoenolpyruvate mutase family protein [Chitinophagaceae bacterium]|nr:isocitrate lyase/phosphoenolpyruvate mutase family protein [Chitinophagaceae bacterium]
MPANILQKEKAERFHALHHSGNMLVLPNIWDTLGALLLESLDYPALATASAAVAWANGYNDGEHIPFNDFLKLLKRICECVDIPVSADIESGFADNDIQLQENIRLLIDAGIVGINIEDTDKKSHCILSTEAQCNKIRLIRKASDEKGIPLFINARTDVYLHEKNFANDAEQFQEAIIRGLAYKEAGADGFYPIAMKDGRDIREIMDWVDLPLNVITMPGIPDLKTLDEMGVARVSLGPSFLKISIQAMKQLATQLKEYQGLLSITGNEVTSNYIKSLINKKQ